MCVFFTIIMMGGMQSLIVLNRCAGISHKHYFVLCATSLGTSRRGTLSYGTLYTGCSSSGTKNRIVVAVCTASTWPIAVDALNRI